MRYDIRADVKKNILYVILDGFFTDEELREAVSTTFREIDKLKPGFGIINDISKFKPASQEGAQDIARGQTYAMEHGAGRVIRVVGEMVSKMQFERVARHTGANRADVAVSIEDAEKMLDE